MGNNDKGDKSGATRGLLIVLEGPDGAGISTQTARLQAALVEQDFKCVATKEPTMGPIGSVIRQALSHRLVYPPAEPFDTDVMALLYAADRLDHLRADILPRLHAGIHVVCDRYRLSSYAYQGLTSGLDWVRTLNSRSLAPDLTIFIDVPLEVSRQRIISRGGHVELYETEERLRPIYANYLALIERAQLEGEKIVVVDGTPPPDTVAAGILGHALKALGAEG